MNGFALSVLVFMVAGAQAFVNIGRGNPTATSDGRPVSQECLQKAQVGDCDFYNCFEERLECGSDWYIIRQGLYYCQKMGRKRNQFTTAGQNFLTDAQRCMTQSLTSWYQRDYANCHDLEHAAVDAIAPCFIDNGFCSVLQENTGAFLNLYEFGDLFTQGSLKVWRMVGNLTAQCARDRIVQMSAGTGERIRTAFQNVFNNNDN